VGISCQKKFNVNFEIYIADLKATTGIGKAFSAPLRLHRSTTTGTLLLDSPSPEGSWLSELQQSTNWIVQWALRQWFQLAEGWWNMMWKKRCSNSNPWPMDLIASVLPTAPQRLWRAYFPLNDCALSVTCRWLWVMSNDKLLNYSHLWILMVTAMSAIQLFVRIKPIAIKSSYLK